MFKLLITLMLTLSYAHAHDAKEIQKVLNQYFQGYQKADSKLIMKAFHPDTKLLSVDEKKMDVLPILEWVKSIDERNARGDIRPGQMQILALDITREAAVVKLHLQFEKFDFIDYLSLLKIQNKWIIVGKIYHFQPK